VPTAGLTSINLNGGDVILNCTLVYSAAPTAEAERERIDALSRKWFKLSAGGNLEHKLKPLFGNALRLARKGSPAPTAKGSEFGRRLRGKGDITGVKLTQGCPRMNVCIDDQAGILGLEKTPLIADITRRMSNG
jgi:hypothetical protein